MEEIKSCDVVTNPHHRRPRSIGGTSAPANISFVKKDDHVCWHLIFGNMNAFQIANRINQMNDHFKPSNVKVTCVFINGSQVQKGGGNNSKNKSLIKKSCDYLFDGLNFYQKIDYINNVWFDPSYHLYVNYI
jgi:hypothetical protein